MKHLVLVLVSLLGLIHCDQPAEEDGLKKVEKKHPQLEQGDSSAVLIARMIDALGGLDRYHALIDVEYTYTYRNSTTGKQDVSLERYLYDGEKSWARYEEHTNRIFPDTIGVVIQGYNGATTWTTFDGNRVTDNTAIRRADFQRKTNFYWLNMMFKLLDPGTRFEESQSREVNGIDYQVVKVAFDKNVGDAQDIYVLYINPNTQLVDQFLFTVMDFGRTEPFLMRVEYEEINGLKWPAHRKYAPSNWEGVIAEDASWIEKISREVKFNVGIDKVLFEPPSIE